MANTTNYNWATPDNTDLVKDGAAAIRTLGNSIDTTTKALNPETTLGDIAYRSSTSNTNTRLPIGSNGQILGVSAGVPAWINNDQGDITEVQAGTGISVASGTGPIPVVTNTVATAYDAKGDLIVGTGADTFSKLSVGTNGYTLVADSSETTGLKWAAAAAGGSLTLLSTTTLTSTSNSITIAPTGYVNLLVLFREVRAASNNGTFFGRFNADTGTNHTYGQWRKYMGGAGDFQVPQNQSSFEITNQLGTSSAYQSALSGSMDVFRVNDTSKIAFECRVLNFNDSSQAGWYHTFGNYNASAAITNLTLIGSQNLSGTVYIYGVK